MELNVPQSVTISETSPGILLDFWLHDFQDTFLFHLCDIFIYCLTDLQLLRSGASPLWSFQQMCLSDPLYSGFCLRWVEGPHHFWLGVDGIQIGPFQCTRSSWGSFRGCSTVFFSGKTVPFVSFLVDYFLPYQWLAYDACCSIVLILGVIALEDHPSKSGNFGSRQAPGNCSYQPVRCCWGSFKN